MHYSLFPIPHFPPVAVSMKQEIMQWMTPSDASKALAASPAVLKQNRCPSLDESARYSARGGDGGGPFLRRQVSFLPVPGELERVATRRRRGIKAPGIRKSGGNHQRAPPPHSAFLLLILPPVVVGVCCAFSSQTEHMV